jgi:hypothetical protein
MGINIMIITGMRFKIYTSSDIGISGRVIGKRWRNIITGVINIGYIIISGFVIVKL